MVRLQIDNYFTSFPIQFLNTLLNLEDLAQRPSLITSFIRMQAEAKTENAILVEHPISQQALSVLRDSDSTMNQFREACAQVVPVVLLEATRDIELKKKQIKTPLCETEGYTIKNDLILVPILRAGISMLDPALKLMPFAKVGYFGMQRDEQTAIASTYYQKLPPVKGADVILLDPMLATGGSAEYALSEISKLGPRSLSFCCIVSAPEGLNRLSSKFPDVKIYTLAIDEKLDANAYIVPGLGDFGDRFHGTC